VGLLFVCCDAAAGPSFDREVVERMVEGCDGRPPLIFPLSNPTSKAEITLADAVRWSDGNLLFAAGSPTADVQHNGTTVFGSQANNMLIFPGVGMGAHLAQASTITDGMLLAAAFTVADFVPASDVARGKCVHPHPHPNLSPSPNPHPHPNP
jgi:malic enzyme